MKKQMLLVAACVLTSSGLFAMDDSAGKSSEGITFGFDKKAKVARVVQGGKYGAVVLSVPRYRGMMGDINQQAQEILALQAALRKSEDATGQKEEARVALELRITELTQDLKKLGTEKGEQAEALQKELTALREEYVGYKDTHKKSDADWGTELDDLEQRLQKSGEAKGEQGKELARLRIDHGQCAGTLKTELANLGRRKDGEARTALKALESRNTEALETQRTQLEAALAKADEKEKEKE